MKYARPKLNQLNAGARTTSVGSEWRLSAASGQVLSDPQLRREVDRLSSIWANPELPGSVDIVFSSRLTRTLGRADVVRRRVTLAACLNGTGAVFDEVLCHELAHIVAFDMVGRAERVHGATWQRLVAMAGFVPRRKLQTSLALANRSTGRRGRIYLHCCQVCGFSRIAARRMSTWRCADCVAAGLDGCLDVSELSARP